MGFKDAMKSNVEGLARRSMEAGAKGQAKMEAMQAKRRGDGLLHDLGAARQAECWGAAVARGASACASAFDS